MDIDPLADLVIHALIWNEYHKMSDIRGKYQGFILVEVCTLFCPRASKVGIEVPTPITNTTIESNDKCNIVCITTVSYITYFTLMGLMHTENVYAKTHIKLGHDNFVN